MEERKKYINRISKGNKKRNSFNIIIKEKNYGLFKYKKEEKKLNILGLKFVKNNKKKCRLIVNNKLSDL